MRPNESFIEQPIRSLQTMLRVLAEDDSRLPTVFPDGIYGPDTMHAVSSFQRQNNLQPTGITDKTTWDAIVTKYEPALIRVEKAEPVQIYLSPGEIIKKGASSPYVYLLQSMLTQLSSNSSTIPSPGHSGVMDQSTVDALKSFQKMALLPETGEFDKITWKHLVLHFSANAHHVLADRMYNRE